MSVLRIGVEAALVGLVVAAWVLSCAPVAPLASLIARLLFPVATIALAVWLCYEPR
jgi:hypothetical protein